MVCMGGNPLEPRKVAVTLGKCTARLYGRRESVDESRKLSDERVEPQTNVSTRNHFRDNLTWGGPGGIRCKDLTSRLPRTVAEVDRACSR